MPAAPASAFGHARAAGSKPSWGNHRAAHTDAGLRYSFRPAGARLRPYLELGASRVGTREDLRSSTVLHSRGRLNYTEVNGQPLDGSRRYEPSRFNIGFRWRP